MARPKKDESDLHQNRLSIYLNDDDYQLINLIAHKKRTAAGVVGRALLVSGLDKMDSVIKCNEFKPSLNS